MPEYLLSQGQGTYIKVYMPASRPVHEEYLKRDLAKMYAPAIKQGRKLMWTNTYHGSFKGMQQLADPFNQFKESVKVSGSLHHNGQTYDVEGEVGIVPNLPIRQCRVSFGFSSRVLFATTDCFADGQSDKFDGRDICGLIQLKAGWQPQLSTMRTASTTSSSMPS